MSALQKLEQVLVKGDLAVLNEAERIEYYKKVCESTGLNPFTKPFDYIVLNRKMVLYASKGCSDQLRKVHKVDIKVTDKSMEDGIFYVTVEATDSSGRTDTDMGAVSIGGLKGEAKANAMMKTITKAKRRVTLSICGLGMLDETEVATIPGAKPIKAATPSQIVETLNKADSVTFVLNFSDGKVEECENKEKYFERYTEIQLAIYKSSLHYTQKLERMKNFEDRNILNIQSLDIEIATEVINKVKKWTTEIIGGYNNA
tara:strand:- start:707 stop:1480 length:774 start_codon:yes stop_codon:yes gene_type:complete